MAPRVKAMMAFVIIAATFFAVSNRFTPQFVLATGVGTDIIYGCKSDTTGLVNIITSSGSCSVGQTPIQWRQGPEQGTEFPFVCGNCLIGGIDTLQGRDLTNAWLKDATVTSADLSHTTMTHAMLEGTYLSYSNISSADLTNARMTGATADSVDFTSSTLTNADFTNAILTSSIGLTTSSVSGATFSNTACPDGTNSDTNGGTCVGHLTP